MKKLEKERQVFPGPSSAIVGFRIAKTTFQPLIRYACPIWGNDMVVGGTFT